MEPSISGILANVVKAYQHPAGSGRDQAIKNAMPTPEDQQIVKTWLEAHPHEAEISPLIQDLKTRIVTPQSVNPSPSSSIVASAIYYASSSGTGMNQKMPGNLDVEDIENAIVSENLDPITEYFTRYPETLPAHADLLKMHLAIGTLSIADAIPLLKQMPMNILMEICSTKDSGEKTMLHDPDTLHVILPLLLEKLSTKDIQQLFSIKNSDGQTPMPVITAEMMASLSKSQCLRLAAVLTNHPDETPELMSRLPPFAHTYHILLQHADSYDPSTIIDAIKNQIDANEDEKDAAIAHFIEFGNIGLSDIVNTMSREEFLRLGPHLRFVDFRSFDNIPLAQKMLKNCPNLNTLLIENDEILEGISSLPLCQMLNCSNCQALTALPALPLCQTLNCSSCPALRALPALPLCRALYCFECSALTALPALPLCQTLHCYDCITLGEILALPLCQTLYCRDCSALTALPALPLCHELYCLDCITLGEILALPLCQTLNCGGCCFLRALPALPLCQTLNCRGCSFLLALPALPQCRRLDYSHCPGIREIPEVPFGAHVISESTTQFLTFNVDVEKFATEPLTLIHQLGQYLLNNQPFPNVNYFEKGQPSPGVDAGGIRRDFVTRLSENLFKQNLSEENNGKFLCLTEESMPKAIDGVEGEYKAYRTLGVLFAYCYERAANFKTGPLFNPRVYQFLTAPGEPGSDEWLAYNYLHSQYDSPKIIEALISRQGELPQLTQKDLQMLAYVEDDEREDYTQFTQDYLLQNREQIRQKLLDTAKERLEQEKEIMQVLRAVSWIAETMKRKLGDGTWGMLRAQGAEALQERVEGVISAPLLKGKLTWEPSPSITPQRLVITQNYLTTWIDQASREQLATFVRFVTGCKTLSDANLKMEVYDCESGRIPVAHTCYYSLELSGNYESQEQFNEKLEIALDQGMAGTGITFA